MTGARAAVLMARHYAATVVRGKANLLLMLLDVGVVAVFAVGFFVLHGGRGHTPEDLYLGFMTMAPLGFLVQFGALVHGIAVISEEEDLGTAPYMLVRPLPRWAVFTGRFVTGLLAVFLPMALLTLAGVLAAAPAEPSRCLLAGLLTTLLATTGYMLFFSWLATRLRHPVMVGMFVLVAWELWVSVLPFTIHNLTFKYHLIELLKSLIGS